jgi:hypothetical protein
MIRIPLTVSTVSTMRRGALLRDFARMILPFLTCRVCEVIW